MIHVSIVHISPALSQAEYELLLTFVSEEKRSRARRFRFAADAHNTLVGDILARIEICKAKGIDNNDICFLLNEYGKPYLAGSYDIHFNISHTGRYVACVVSCEPVGIDIELIKPIDLKIAERFFTKDEALYVFGNQIAEGTPDGNQIAEGTPDGDQSIARFFEVWTKKESRLKWEGKGFSKPLPSFSVFSPKELEMLNYYKVFDICGTVCHVCSALKEPPVVVILNTAELMRQAKTWLLSK